MACVCAKLRATAGQHTPRDGYPCPSPNRRAIQPRYAPLVRRIIATPERRYICMARTRRRRLRPLAHAGRHGPVGAAHHTPLGLGWLGSKGALTGRLRHPPPTAHTHSTPGTHTLPLVHTLYPWYTHSTPGTHTLPTAHTHSTPAASASTHATTRTLHARYTHATPRTTVRTPLAPWRDDDCLADTSCLRPMGR